MHEIVADMYISRFNFSSLHNGAFYLPKQNMLFDEIVFTTSNFQAKPCCIKLVPFWADNINCNIRQSSHVETLN